jgi:hypothetical protein
VKGITEPTEKLSEKLPRSEFYKVVDSVPIFRSGKCWEVIVVYEAFGKRSIGFYLWENRNGAWKRKNNFSVRNINERNKIKENVDQLASKLASN